MNHLPLLLSFLVLPLFIAAQDADSLSVSLEIDSLIQVSRDLTGKRDFEQALAVNAEAERLVLEVFGRESAEYGNCMFNHGRILYFKGAYDDVEEYYFKSRDIREKLLGKEHPDYAAVLNNLGSLYYAIGDFKKAEPCWVEALGIRERVFGKAHGSYTMSLHNLAILYMESGEYEQSEPLYLNALTIQEQVSGKKNPDYAGILENYATMNRKIGLYKKAEKLYLESLSIKKELHGKTHVSYARTLDNLATAYKETGQLGTSEILYKEAIAIRAEILGNDDQDYAASLNNLADMYTSVNAYAKAERLYVEAMNILEKKLSKKHLKYAQILNNLAVLYKKMSRFDEAEFYYQEALSIREIKLGKQHPDYAVGLSNLASLYNNMGYYKKAEMFHQESISIIEKTIGKNHPNYATRINNLANNYADMGDYFKAEQLYKEALSIIENTIGKLNPDYIDCAENLAIFYSEIINYENACFYFKEVSDLQKAMLRDAIHFQSEQELSTYISKFTKSLNFLLSFSHYTTNIKTPNYNYNDILFYKKVLLNSVEQVYDGANRDSVVYRKLLQLRSHRRRLSSEYAKPIAERKNVEELEEQANTLEKELRRSIPGFDQALKQVTWQDVLSNLPSGHAAIEFVHFRYYNPNPTDSTMYVALVLLPGAAFPAFIPLCEERELTSLLDSSGTSTFYAGLYRGETKFVPVNTGKAQGKALYDLIWQPVEELLQGTKTIHFAPSGLLHRLNLAAIKTPSDSLLGERHQLITLGSTRQLVPEATIRPDILGQEIALFGGIHFEADSTLAPPPIDSTDMFFGTLRSAYIDSTQRQSTWGYLKGTAREVQNIHVKLERKGLPVRLHTGHKATEEALKQLGEAGQLSPRVLHLATHGFFSPDPKAVSHNLDGEPVFKWSDNPMIRSGLVLAGGNHAWQHGRPLYPGMEDGILTAQEITQMNLRNTELVVLSACETGLGDIEGNEGVYGLQRAFKIAGAQYLIMSLWKVPDAETAEFMEAFYGHWLEGDGMSIPDAFRETQEEMRVKYKEPYRWAGFVLVE